MLMQLNRKLSKILKGRTIQSESGDAGYVIITFQDGSTLKLKVAGQATVPVGAKVKAVHEAGESFQMDLEGGPAVLVRLADPGSSVALRDRHGDAAAYNLYAIERDGNGWRCEAVTRGVANGAVSEMERRSLSLRH